MLPGLAYPVYTCVCPQTKWTFDVRCLTVSEEDKLLQSATFGYQMLHNLNEVIYRCITAKPDTVKTFEDFRKKVTQKDRDALLYSLVQASDADKQVIETTCFSCRAQETVTVKLSDCFSATLYEGEEGKILEERPTVTSTVGEWDIVFTLRAPTLEHERQVMTYLGTKPTVNILTLLLITEKIEFKKAGEDTVKEEATNLSDIEVAVRSLPSKVIKKVRKAYQTTLGKYGIDLKYKFICSSCGATNEHTIDLVEALFRTVAGE